MGNRKPDTVDGRTRNEWRQQLEKEGLPEEQVNFILAVTFGDIPGDSINIDEHPDLDEE